MSICDAIRPISNDGKVHSNSEMKNWDMEINGWWLAVWYHPCCTSRPATAGKLVLKASLCRGHPHTHTLSDITKHFLILVTNKNYFSLSFQYYGTDYLTMWGPLEGGAEAELEEHHDASHWCLVPPTPHYTSQSGHGRHRRHSTLKVAQTFSSKALQNIFLGCHKHHKIE